MPFPSQKTIIRAAQLFIVIASLVAAEFLTRFGFVSDLFLPAPSQVIREFAVLVRNGELLHHTLVTSSEFITGFGATIPVAIWMGLVIGRFRALERLLAPFLAAGMALPVVALAPLVVLWLGIGPSSKIGLVVFAAFFPIVYNTIVAVRATDPLLIKAARSLGASEFQLVVKVILPSAFPVILTGLKLGLGRALIGAIIGEMIASEAGLGWMIMVAAGTFRTARVFVGLFVVTLISISLLEVIRHIERRVALMWTGVTS